MFNMYLAKVNSILKRALSASEIEIARQKFEARWNYKATAEYLK